MRKYHRLIGARRDLILVRGARFGLWKLVTTHVADSVGDGISRIRERERWQTMGRERKGRERDGGR